MIKLKECFRLNNKQELIKIKMMHICKINYFCRQLGNQSFIIFAVINQNKYLKKKKKSREGSNIGKGLDNLIKTQNKNSD